MILYDDTFAAQFKGDAAKAEITKMVNIANGIFKKDSLKIKIQLDVMTIEHAKGSKWDGDTGAQYL